MFCLSKWGVFSIIMGSIFNYPGEYVQLPWGVFSTTLGSMFNYPGESVQLPWGVCSTTLGSMFNYPGEYFQLPWGACSTTLTPLTDARRRASSPLRRATENLRHPGAARRPMLRVISGHKPPPDARRMPEPRRPRTMSMFIARHGGLTLDWDVFEKPL